MQSVGDDKCHEDMNKFLKFPLILWLIDLHQRLLVQFSSCCLFFNRQIENKTVKRSIIEITVTYTNQIIANLIKAKKNLLLECILLQDLKTTIPRKLHLWMLQHAVVLICYKVTNLTNYRHNIGETYRKLHLVN